LTSNIPAGIREIVKTVQDLHMQRKQIGFSLFGGYMEAEHYLQKVSSMIGLYMMEVGAVEIVEAVLCTLLEL
jgi:hypothetical protein